MIRDAFRFLYWNVRHYTTAIYGIGCKLDPDYPQVWKFFPRLISDVVFEYRTYGAMPLVSLAAVGAISVIGELPVWGLIMIWAALSFRRSCYFRSNLEYWARAYYESPKKHRIRIHFAEWLIRETERHWKRGERGKAIELESLAWKLQDEICGKPVDMSKYT
jgi:hypothetical protein